MNPQSPQPAKSFEDTLNDYGLIVSDPAILGGTPCIIGTRVPVEILLQAHTLAVSEAVEEARREAQADISPLFDDPEVLAKFFDENDLPAFAQSVRKLAQLDNVSGERSDPTMRMSISRSVLEHLDELACLGQLDAFHGSEVTNPKLMELSEALYRVTHWYLSPSCRKNHESWNPEALPNHADLEPFDFEDYRAD